MERKMIIRLIISGKGLVADIPALRVDRIYEILSVSVSKMFNPNRREVGVPEQRSRSKRF
jgi:hypothetical protein